ncbi:unnamed protein product [Amoebophrya sp. A120]|nr:unnamed protein product [Amoebophrya sp. A120]|eukprot:GSA120T00023699001.1
MQVVTSCGGCAASKSEKQPERTRRPPVYFAQGGAPAGCSMAPAPSPASVWGGPCRGLRDLVSHIHGPKSPEYDGGSEVFRMIPDARRHPKRARPIVFSLSLA